MPMKNLLLVITILNWLNVVRQQADCFHKPMVVGVAQWVCLCSRFISREISDSQGG
jgi:hypothetical protein